MLTNDLTHAFATENLAVESEDEERPHSDSGPGVQFVVDLDREESDKDVSRKSIFMPHLFFSSHEQV